MRRMWIRSWGSFQVHSWAMLSTSKMQFGGIHVTGGGKRSTPRTVAGFLVNILIFCILWVKWIGILDLPVGNMSATSLEEGEWWFFVNMIGSFFPRTWPSYPDLFQGQGYVWDLQQAPGKEGSHSLSP